MKMKNSMILDSDIPVVLGNCIRVDNVEKRNGKVQIKHTWIGEPM